MAAEGAGNIVLVEPMFSALKEFEPSTISFTGWLQLFQEFCIANNVQAEPEPIQVNGQPQVVHNQKRALFLSYIGSQAYELLRERCLPDLPNSKPIPVLGTLLEAKYAPVGLKATNRFLFSKKVQQENESVSDFIAAIQSLASKCDFGAYLDDALLDKLLAGIRDDPSRRKLLNTDELTYAKACEIVLQHEAVRNHSRTIASSIQVAKVSTRKPNRYNQNHQSNHGSTSNNSNVNYAQNGSDKKNKYSKPNKDGFGPCHRCGQKHDVKTCQAVNWTCFKCQKKGHMAKVCRQKNAHVRAVQSDNSRPDPPVNEEVDRLLSFHPMHSVNTS